MDKPFDISKNWEISFVWISVMMLWAKFHNGWTKSKREEWIFFLFKLKMTVFLCIKSGFRYIVSTFQGIIRRNHAVMVSISKVMSRFTNLWIVVPPRCEYRSIFTDYLGPCWGICHNDVIQIRWWLDNICWFVFGEAKNCFWKQSNMADIDVMVSVQFDLNPNTRGNFVLWLYCCWLMSNFALMVVLEFLRGIHQDCCVSEKLLRLSSIIVPKFIKSIWSIVWAAIG